MQPLSTLELTDEEIYAIAASSPEELRGQSLTDVFSTVAKLQTETLKLHKNSANSASYYVDETAVDIDIRVEALITLSRSVRHTPAYLELLERSRKKQIELIGRDKQLIKNLRQWAANDKNSNWNTAAAKRSLKKIHQHHVNATNAVIKDFCSISVKKTDILLVDKPGRWAVIKLSLIHI